MPQASLVLLGISAGYGRNRVLHDVTMSVAKGDIVGLIGPNGSGKTTLLRTLFGVTPPMQGRIEFEDEDVVGLSPRQRLQRGMAYVPQERNVFPNLSVRENLEIAAASVAPTAVEYRDRRDFVLSLFPRLAERQNQLAGSMSGGEQRMVAIGIGLMAKPRLLMLDEPTTGLAPQIVHQLMSVIQKLNAEHGATIIIVEQNILSLVKVVAAVELVKGGVVRRYPGKPAEIIGKNIWEYL
jgi:branched-chain amino acid transport system ATP-binding protein